jgi:hypothetical protein
MLYQLSYSRKLRGVGARRISSAVPYHVPNAHPAEPPVGLEPTTARLRIECSTTELRWRRSGAEGTRTPGLLGAIQALSQLSYSPKFHRLLRGTRGHRSRCTVGARGLEPLTSTMST